MPSLNSQDLQVAKIDGSSFPMEHQMGLLKGNVPAAASADNVIVYDGNTYNASADGEKWTRITAECTFTTWNASTTFTSSTNTPYHDTSNRILYYIAKPNDATISISSTAGASLYAWSASGSNTTISDKIKYKTFTIATPDYSNAFNQKIWKFSYTGSGKQWVAPHAGTYTMECWGANGGTPPSIGSNTIGIGGYVAGDIALSQGNGIYVFVGQQGVGTGAAGNLGGWNGGGSASYGQYYPTGGGGSTDIRVQGNTNSTWYDVTHLRTRIMVAAGGGGCGNYTGYTIYGGHGGGLNGYRGGSTSTGSSGDYSNYSKYPNTGGSQTSGGSAYISQTPGFGYAGFYNAIGSSTGYAGGGGGGWYGGVRGYGQGGSGGSSFISGHPGCNAVNPSTGAHLGVSTTMTIGGKEYRFVDGTTKMIDGSGKEWTTASQTTGGTYKGIPTKPSQSNNNNGYARITYIKP